jgi:hypothetical protein
LKKIPAIRNAVRDIISPLPDPKTETYKKYWTVHLPHLSSHQIELIVAMVIEGARLSRSYGLFIRQTDLDHETVFFLALINLYGGPQSISTGFTYEDFRRLSSKALFEEMGSISEYYFNKIKTSKPKITKSDNAYNCHLEDVLSRIVNAIFNDKIPLI